MSADPRSVLIICDIVPGHRSAGEVRLTNVCELFAERGSVALLALDRHLDERDGARVDALRSMGVDVIDVYGAMALRTGLTLRPYALVIIEFWHVAERAMTLVRAKQPWATVAVDTVDLHFLREERGMTVGHGTTVGVEDRKRRELAVYLAADVRIFTSAAELDHYRVVSSVVDGNVIVCTVVHPRDRIARDREPLVVFVGNFWHAPNLDGVKWFAEQVWPAVRAAVPEATFAIAGSRVGPEVRRLGSITGIEVRGFVADIHALYEEARVVVAPLRFGAGVKGKVTEALAAGMPLVVTSIATEGLGVAHEVDLLVADGAEEYAIELIRLLTQPALGEFLGSNGRAAIEGRCGVAQARSVLHSLAQSAVEGSDRVGGVPSVPWRLWSLPDRCWIRIQPILAAAAAVARSSRRRVGRLMPPDNRKRT